MWAQELGLGMWGTSRLCGWGVRALAVFVGGWASVHAGAQLCTTQSKLTPALRETLAQTALELASAVKAGDVAAVRAGTVSSLTANFGSTEVLLRATSAELSGDTLRVTQLYVLDATSRTANEASGADFSCPLTDAAASETDFSINGLPAGRFAFAMVEAADGPHPWLLAFLLQQDGADAKPGDWKMAGFYPHPRTAGGHDGLWFWTDARAKVAAKQPWAAWLEYGEADTLLRPAAFVSSTHLDTLHGEQHTAAPPGLTEGVSAESPVMLKDGERREFRITHISAGSAEGDGPVRLEIHVAGQAGTAPAALRAQGTAAAQALIAAHPELQPVFTGVLVLVDNPGGSPEVVSVPMGSLHP